MHLEGLIEDLGGFGRYQIIIIIITTLIQIMVAPSMMTMAFAGVEPDWWFESRDGNGSTIVNGSHKNCEWNLTSMYARTYSGDMDTIVSKWDLVCGMKWVGNTIISIQMVGVLVGSIIAGYFADHYGRTKVIYSGLLLNCVGNLIAAFSVSWVMFTVLRLVIGLAAGMVLSVVFLYQMEFVGTKYRGIIISLPIWSFGVVLFGVLAWLFQHWKWIHICIAALASPLLLTWLFVPESIRWLAIKGRLEEARRVVSKMATCNGKPIPDTSILELIAKEEKSDGDKATSYSYLHLFNTRTLTKKTIVSCFMWFSLSVVYYAIAFGVKNLSGNFYHNLLIMAMMDVPTSFIVFFVAHLLGRRWACGVLYIISSCACLGVAITTRLAPEDIRVPMENGFAISAKMFTLSAWLTTQALTSEQYPTVIRNLAVAAHNTAARIGGILAGQLFSLTDNNDLMPPFLAMGILMTMAGMCCFILDETRRKALEDTMCAKEVLEVKTEAVEHLLEELAQKGDRVSNGEGLQMACVNRSDGVKDTTETTSIGHSTAKR